MAGDIMKQDQKIDSQLEAYIHNNCKLNFKYIFMNKRYVRKLCIDFMNSEYNDPWYPVTHCAERYLRSINQSKNQR